mmetsp:Transcript_32028/g.65974  ORF Transcript_32028/g.65974 Transcript_32028/m.65974 type:complete len:221 (-) Transcript_32028:626-1288(-)
MAEDTSVSTPLLGAGGGTANAAAPACGLRKRGAAARVDGSVDKQSAAASVATLLLTLPALLGSCCWPVLLAGIIGISATAASRNISHTFSLALTLAILTNLIQFMAHKAATKPGALTHWQRYGPVWLLAAATPLILADQVRHCLQDSGIWPEPGSSMFRDDCDKTTGLSGFWCLTPVGWLFAICFTYSGFGLMMASVIWSTKIFTKLQRAWNGDDCGCEV